MLSFVFMTSEQPEWSETYRNGKRWSLYRVLAKQWMLPEIIQRHFHSSGMQLGPRCRVHWHLCLLEKLDLLCRRCWRCKLVVRDKPHGDVFCFFVLDLDIDGIVISQFTLFGMKQTKLAEAQGRTTDSHTLLWRYLVDCTRVVTQEATTCINAPFEKLNHSINSPCLIVTKVHSICLCHEQNESTVNSLTLFLLHSF